MADFQLDTGFALLMLSALSAPVIAVLVVVLWSDIQSGKPGTGIGRAVVVLVAALVTYRLTPGLGFGIVGHILLPLVASVLAARFGLQALGAVIRGVGRAAGSLPRLGGG